MVAEATKANFENYEDETILFLVFLRSNPDHYRFGTVGCGHCFLLLPIEKYGQQNDKS